MQKHGIDGLPDNAEANSTHHALLFAMRVHSAEHQSTPNHGSFFCVLQSAVLVCLLLRRDQKSIQETTLAPVEHVVVGDRDVAPRSFLGLTVSNTIFFFLYDMIAKMPLIAVRVNGDTKLTKTRFHRTGRVLLLHRIHHANHRRTGIQGNYPMFWE